MKGAWGRMRSQHRRHVPVEMRFVDMFMAALGALVFLAMLLSFLLRFLPKETKAPTEPLPQTAEVTTPLKFLTNSLPAARVGELYHVPLAYRGGRGRILWEIAVGEKDIPSGIKFDTEQGVVAGTPTKEGIGRFVVRITDRSGVSQLQSLDLRVDAPRAASRQWEKWLGIALAVLLGVGWIRAQIEVSRCRRIVREFESTHQAGQKQIVYNDPTTGGQFIFPLPDSIPMQRARMQTAVVKAFFLLLLFLLVLGWLIWRWWFARE